MNDQCYFMVFGLGAKGQGFIVEVDFPLTFSLVLRPGYYLDSFQSFKVQCHYHTLSNIFLTHSFSSNT